MARIRTIKPEIRRSLTVGAWPREVRLAWIYLWGYLDDDGRGHDDLRLIRSELFPLDDDVTTKKLDKWLTLMSSEKNPENEWPPLCRYEVAGRRYLHAVYWREHQRINRPTPSPLPPCPIHEDSLNPHGVTPEAFTEGSPPSRAPAEQGAGNREQGAGSGEDSAAPAAPNGGLLLAQFLDGFKRKTGAPYPDRSKGHLAGQIGGLLKVYDGQTVAKALDRLLERGLGPAKLPDCVADVLNPTPRRQPLPQPVDASGRPIDVSMIYD